MRTDLVLVPQVTHCVPQGDLVPTELTHCRAPVEGLTAGVRPEAVEVPESAVALSRVVHEVLRPGEKVVLFMEVGGAVRDSEGRVRGGGAGHLVDDGHGVLDLAVGEAQRGAGLL